MSLITIRMNLKNTISQWSKADMKNRKYTYHLHGHANKLRLQQRTMVLSNGFQRMPARRNFEGDKQDQKVGIAFEMYFSQ